MTRRRPDPIAERSVPPAAGAGERRSRPIAPERVLADRVIREDEWLDPGLARRRAAAGEV